MLSKRSTGGPPILKQSRIVNVVFRTLSRIAALITYNTLKIKNRVRLSQAPDTRPVQKESSMPQLNEQKARSGTGRALATAALALLCVTALSQPNPVYAHGGGGGGGGGSHDGGGGGSHGGGGGGGFHGGGGGGGFHGGGGGGGFHAGGGFHGGGFGGGFHGGAFGAGGLGGFHGGGFHGSHFGRDRDDFRHHGGDRDDFRRRGGFGSWWGYDYGYPDYGYASQYWYYCQDPPGYYPYVQQCGTGWQMVPAG